MELIHDTKETAEKVIDNKEHESAAIESNDEAGYVIPQKKPMLPRVIIALLAVAIALVGILLVVRYFNQETSLPTEATELPAGVSPDNVVTITEDEDGNMSATDGYGNPIDLGLEGMGSGEDASSGNENAEE